MSSRDRSESSLQEHRSWLGRLFGFGAQGPYIVGVISDVAAAEAARQELLQTAARADDVVLLSAEEVAERAGGDGTDWPNEVLTEEGTFCADYNGRAIGSAIISMNTHSGDDVARAYRILSAHDAHEIVYFGGWTIRELPRKAAQRAVD
jgi:hypothetical protein